MIKNVNEYIGVKKEDFNLIKCIYYIFLISGLVSVSVGLIAPYLKIENDLTYALTGKLLSAHNIGNLTAILCAGVLPYAIGRKQSTILLGSGIFLGLLMMILLKGPVFLIIAFALVGVGRGTMTNVSNVTVSQYSTKKGTALNSLHATFAIGALLSPFLIFFSDKLGFNFRLGALLMAAMSFTSIILVSKSKITSSKEKKEKAGNWSFVRDFKFWLDTMVLFFYLCVESAIIGWFVIYFYDLGILPEIVCNFTPSMLWVMIMLGRLICANISNKFDRNILLITMGLFLTISFTGLLFSTKAVFAIISLLGIGFFMSGIYPTTVATMSNTDNPLRMGVSLALATSGGVFMPSIVGKVADAKGIQAGIFTVLFSILIMMILMFIKYIRSTKKV
ncbi:MAG: MFS transporter [Lachnospirales bacterium]